jgi:hypothetical protein
MTSSGLNYHDNIVWAQTQCAGSAVAVDRAGNVHVTDTVSNQVLKLPHPSRDRAAATAIQISAKAMSGTIGY